MTSNVFGGTLNLITQSINQSDRRTGDDIIIANLNVSSRSLENHLLLGYHSRKPCRSISIVDVKCQREPIRKYLTSIWATDGSGLAQS